MRISLFKYTSSGLCSEDFLTVYILKKASFTVFDDEEESKLSYTEIHQEYKALVSNIIENNKTSEPPWMIYCWLRFSKGNGNFEIFL